MTQITAAMVKELREKTGAGMMDCKNALANAGDMEGAVKLLREKGLARAAKKTDRVAAEGLIAISTGDNSASMVEVNCETDFVARNDDFKNLVSELAKAANSFDTNEVDNTLNIDGEKLNEKALASGSTVASTITDKIATIGEKIALRRFAVLNGDLYGSYLHGAGSIGVVVSFNLNDKSLKGNEDVMQAARDVAMHTAASNPSFIKESDIPASWIKHEREIFMAQVLEMGKPESMAEKIVDGKMNKHKKDFCLLDQPFVKNPDQTVKAMLDELQKNTGAVLEVAQVCRFKVGEGIEKKEDNFADEVKKMTT